MFTLFNGSRTAAIGIGKNAAEAVVLAARDLQRDLRALSGQPCGFPIVTEGAISAFPPRAGKRSITV